MEDTIVLSTKARTLEALQGRLTTARVPSLVWFTIEEWQNNSDHCLRRIIDRLESPWIVRSSCLREDGSELSNAGEFLSVQNVEENNLRQAIEEVIASYGNVNPLDEILVQPMLRGVIRSGVAFSHDPNTCSPYRVVNWAEGEDTSAVTGGKMGRCWQQAACAQKQPPTITPIIRMLEELLVIVDQMPLDCEFAVTREDGVEILWLLQARPLVLRETPERNEHQTRRLRKVAEKVAKGMGEHPFLMGKRTVYGVMPDWNPAEIIGVRPKPLALSLYRELVTDSIWAYQRHNYGYRNLRSFPLMPHFWGMPYIDVRLSFNSFVPADLPASIADRLVDYYIDRLLDEPSLHDKVEFEIVLSCYTLDLWDRMKSLKDAGFSKRELEILAESLRGLTNRILHPEQGIWFSDAERLEILNRRRKELFDSTADKVDRIYWLLEDAKRYGTLPFAGLARAGFIAVQMLRSLVTCGVFDENDYHAFMNSVSTVSGRLARDRIQLDKTSFLREYGHLRPGTYDILSPRYDRRPDLYFDWSRHPLAVEESTRFSLEIEKIRELGKELREHNIETDPVGLLDFMKSAIEYREWGKFHFTRNVSDALELISEVGEQYGFSRDDMAYCDIGIFQELYKSADDPEALLFHSITRGKKRYSETLKMVLPPLITQPDDVWGFEWPEAEPNFITQKQIMASVVSEEERTALSGSIVCIPSADPGYDWLFAYPIAGLITAWGGPNSHMAIRAGELGIPAVIGAGERLYKQWANAKRLHLDCAARRVEVLL